MLPKYLKTLPDVYVLRISFNVHVNECMNFYST